jgi:hypothetical protein
MRREVKWHPGTVEFMPILNDAKTHPTVMSVSWVQDTQRSFDEDSIESQGNQGKALMIIGHCIYA